MTIESHVEALLKKMTLAEKIGQMWQVNGAAPEHKELVRKGAIGSILNIQGAEAAEFQRLAREESRLGIPLLLGRDVIHGFRTILPIPLGQAASFHPELVRQGAHNAAREATSCGINWTFAPMVDIARDPRWGRIAESCGEDPFLAACMGAAMVEGFQGEDLARPESLAACAKHYVAYGAAEGGRDYNTTLVPEGTLRDVYMPPFQACVKAGVASIMSAFNDLNGVPASGHEFALRQVLKGEWAFDGLVVSDWAAIQEMLVHGFCADSRDAAAAALKAGVDMEMVSTCYVEHLKKLVQDRKLPMALVDDAVRRILRLKLRLGLFDAKHAPPAAPESVLLCEKHLATAKELAVQSCVLLKNDDGLLPLRKTIQKIAVIGTLADSGADQMGCWAMDGVGKDSRTILAALRETFGAAAVTFSPGLATPRAAADPNLLRQAARAAHHADLAVLVLGEEAVLSGEAHCRAFLDLPGDQMKLVEAVVAAGKPVVAIVFTGRPLILGPLAEKVNALYVAWHPGTMGGPALADLLTARAAPSARLPASFPRTVGQVPTYYARKNTGRPAAENARAGVPLGTPLDPKDFVTGYVDADSAPEFPFGYGLTYTTFVYSKLELSAPKIRLGKTLTVTAVISNTGRRTGTEVVQLYVRDFVGSTTRPVRELKAFRRVSMEPGEHRTVTFTLHTDDLGFHNREMKRVTEPGRFQLWVAPDATCRVKTTAEFEVTK